MGLGLASGVCKAPPGVCNGACGPLHWRQLREMTGNTGSRASPPPPTEFEQTVSVCSHVQGACSHLTSPPTLLAGLISSQPLGFSLFFIDTSSWPLAQALALLLCQNVHSLASAWWLSPPEPRETPPPASPWVADIARGMLAPWAQGPYLPCSPLFPDVHS